MTEQGNPQANEPASRTILVTGAGGFIASHLVERLVLEGWRVRAFVRYTSRRDPGLLKLLPGEVYRDVEIIFGDLRDLDAVKDAMQGTSVVFHLGALIAIPYSYLHPVEVVETNISGTLNVLLAARETGVDRLIHTSSSEVYGSALRVPISEDHPLQGQSPYSASKIGADKLAESFFCSYNLPVVTLRPFNTYGPGQSTRAVIPTIITQALRAEVIQLGALHTRRDLTYISDTVDGFIKAALTPGIEGQTINLGSGIEISIEDLATEIIQLVGHTVRIETEAIRLRPEKSEVQRLLSDNRLARELLGWQPQVSLRPGLELTINWIRQHLDLYQLDEYHV
jgi:NAD dependent epimerase/dehydratase